MKNKIIIYDKNASPVNRGFLGHGFGLLKEASRCEITEELNGDYSLELDYPLNGSKAEYLKKWNIIRANGQLFRIYKVENSTEDNRRTAYARHIFYDLAAGFVLDDRVVGGTLEEALNASIPDYFKPHYTTSTDISITNNIYHVRKDGVKCVFDTLERWGIGELVRDNFHLSINYSKGVDTGAIFTAKKMRGIELTADAEVIATRILPVGKEGITLPETYIEIPNWSSEAYPPFHITKEVKWEDVEDEGTLRELAIEYAQTCGFESLNMKIDIAQIAGTTQYKNLYAFNAFNVGDVVTVKHPTLDDLRIKTKIIKRTLDMITEESMIELGQPLSALDDFFFNSVQKQLVNAQANIKNDLQYWQNGDLLEITPYLDKVATLSVSTKSDDGEISAIGFLTLTGTTAIEDELEVKVYRNNILLLSTPYKALKPGTNTATFHWPVSGIGQNENHVFDLVLRTKKGTFSIEKYQATFTITGVGITATKGKSEPRPFIFVDWKPETFKQAINPATSVGIELFDHFEIDVQTTWKQEGLNGDLKTINDIQAKYFT